MRRALVTSLVFERILTNYGACNDATGNPFKAAGKAAKLTRLPSGSASRGDASELAMNNARVQNGGNVYFSPFAEVTLQLDGLVLRSMRFVSI